jgi:hypothetical protein
LPAILLGLLVSAPIELARPQGPRGFLFAVVTYRPTSCTSSATGWTEGSFETVKLHRNARGWVIFLFCAHLSLDFLGSVQSLPRPSTKLHRARCAALILVGVAMAGFSLHPVCNPPQFCLRS